MIKELEINLHGFPENINQQHRIQYQDSRYSLVDIYQLFEHYLKELYLNCRIPKGKPYPSFAFIREMDLTKKNMITISLNGDPNNYDIVFDGLDTFNRVK